MNIKSTYLSSFQSDDDYNGEWTSLHDFEKRKKDDTLNYSPSRYQNVSVTSPSTTTLNPSTCFGTNPISKTSKIV